MDWDHQFLKNMKIQVVKATKDEDGSVETLEEENNMET